MSLAPIILFVYNRKNHTEATVKALAANSLASDSDLFVFSDGPKNSENEKAVSEVRSFIKTISGFKSLTIFEGKTNSGLAGSLIAGISKILSDKEKAIILEDDLVTSPFFLSYMNKALELYEQTDKVAAITGYNYPIQQPLPETFFLCMGESWGWGTWERSWKLFEEDGAKLLQKLEQSGKINYFDFNNTFKFSQMLKNQVIGKIDSWAIRWYATVLLNNKLTLYPRETLLENIGNDGSGVHSKATNKFYSTVINTQIDVEKIHIKENLEIRKKLEAYFQSERFINA